jgi:sugar phosphate isomerase/epimerase
MRVALSMWSVHKYWYDQTWDTVDFIDFAASIPVEGVELLSVFWRDREVEIPRIQKALDRTGLKVACFAACNNFAVNDEQRWNAQMRDVIDSIDAAVLFGANVVRVFSGDNEGHVTFEEAKSKIISGLREAAAYAYDKGVTLCLENHGVFVGKASQVLEVIQTVDSPALQSTFDTGNFLLVDENPNTAIDQLKHCVGHVHLKDFKCVDAQSELAKHAFRSLNGQLFVGTIAGQGDVDLPYIVSQLKDIDYSGWLAVEFEGTEEPKYGSVESIQYLKTIL